MKKIDVDGKGCLKWQTSLSISPAFSHPSLCMCALAKRHLRPKQCDRWDGFPPLRPSDSASPFTPQKPQISRPLPVCVKDLLHICSFHSDLEECGVHACEGQPR